MELEIQTKYEMVLIQITASQIQVLLIDGR
jgi:hypothetical protein